jgi:hypothetical protein
VINADIKIVGAVTDENALEEIEAIAKVFAYEQRMKSFTSPLPRKHGAKKTKIHTNNVGGHVRFIHESQPHILVKGLF